MRRVSNGLIPTFVFVLASTAFVAAQNIGGSPDAKKMKNPVPSSPASIKAGQALFTKNCRFCHGADAKGDGPMAPEGTRKPVERWKSGFYRIALGAGVPIVPGYFDNARKRVGFGAPFWPTGDAERDIAELKAFYRPIARRKSRKVGKSESRKDGQRGRGADGP